MESTDPSLILWKNLGYGSIHRCILATITLTLSFILLSCGFVIIVVLIVYKNSYAQANQIECGNQIIKKELAENDFMDLGYESTILQCFCFQKYTKNPTPFAMYNEYFGTGLDKVSACGPWFESKFTYSLILLGISLVISGLNGFLRHSIRELSRLEGKHTETIRLASAVQKMWFVQFFNTAIILLAINNKFGTNSILMMYLKKTGLDSFLFNGEFEDINSGWYG